MTDLCKTCMRVGDIRDSMEITVTIDKEDNITECTNYLLNTLCDTCIIKNCHAGEVVFGKDNPVTFCRGWHSMKSNLCKTCDWKYCTSQYDSVYECKKYIKKGEK